MDIKIGDTIKKLRQKKRITQKQLDDYSVAV